MARIKKKYKFTGETKVERGIILRRIRRIHDGSLGGWIEKESNLSHDGDCWVWGDAQVSGNARVYGDAQAYENAQVYENALVCGDARIYGNAQVWGDARVFGSAQAHGNAQVFGSARVFGNARIWEDAQVSKPAVCITGFRFPITIVDNGIAIGCQFKRFSEWSEVTKAKAVLFGLPRDEYDTIKAMLSPWISTKRPRRAKR